MTIAFGHRAQLHLFGVVLVERGCRPPQQGSRRPCSAVRHVGEREPDGRLRSSSDAAERLPVGQIAPPPCRNAVCAPPTEHAAMLMPAAVAARSSRCRKPVPSPSAPPQRCVGRHPHVLRRSTCRGGLGVPAHLQLRSAPNVSPGVSFSTTNAEMPRRTTHRRSGPSRRTRPRRPCPGDELLDTVDARSRRPREPPWCSAHAASDPAPGSVRQ